MKLIFYTGTAGIPGVVVGWSGACKPDRLVNRRATGVYGLLIQCRCVPCCSGMVTLKYERYLVDPASGHMLVSKIKPCMSKHEPINGEAANSSLQQPLFT